LEFTKDRLVVLYDEPSSLVDGERMVDVVYRDLRKMFDVICCRLFVTKLEIGGLDRWTARSIENYLDCCAYSAGTKSSWWAVVFLRC